MGNNPWITGTQTEHEPVERPIEAAQDVPDVQSWTGVQSPQLGIPVPDRADQLPRRHVPDSGHLWVLGVHGGAGESTLAGWLSARACGHHWPIAPSGQSRVLLCGSTTSSGIAATRRAAQEWASREVSVSVLGLVLMVDAAGRLPRQLRDEIKHLSGAVPRTWLLPYSPILRLSPEPHHEPAPVDMRPGLSAITRYLHEREKES